MTWPVVAVLLLVGAVVGGFARDALWGAKEAVLDWFAELGYQLRRLVRALGYLVLVAIVVVGIGLGVHWSR